MSGNRTYFGQECGPQAQPHVRLCIFVHKHLDLAKNSPAWFTYVNLKTFCITGLCARRWQVSAGEWSRRKCLG